MSEEKYSLTEYVFRDIRFGNEYPRIIRFVVFIDPPQGLIISNRRCGLVFVPNALTFYRRQ